MNNEPRQGYWGVIPGEVREDRDLTIAAKYLYYILSSMAYEDGYCWPSNEYLASQLCLSKRRAVELLGQLKERGYIKVIMRPCADTLNGERRYIYCGMFPDRVEDGAPTAVPYQGCDEPQGEDAEDCTGGCEISHEGDAENVTHNISRQKKKNNNPLPPKGGRRRAEPDWGLFEAFWAAYPRKTHKDRARSAWRKLSPTPELCQAMAAALERDKHSRQWTKDNGEYIPYPASWLNAKPWEDDPPPTSPGPGQPLRGEGVRYL